MKKLTILIIASFFLFSAFGVKAAPGATIGVPRSVEELLGVDGQYDSHSVLLGNAGLEKLEEIVKNFPIVKVKFKFSIKAGVVSDKDKEGELIQSASGTLFGRYLLTVAHVTIFSPPEIPTPFGLMPLPTTVLDKQFTLLIGDSEYKIREIKIDKDQDWALFEVLEEIKEKMPVIKIGQSSELKIGHYLYLVGDTLGEGPTARQGIVMALLGNFENLPIVINPENGFRLSGGLYSGDSGGPVFALRDGVLEMVGMMQSTSKGTIIGNALKIDSLIEKIKAATGIDLRK